MSRPPLPVLTDYWSRSEDRQRVVNDLFDRSAKHYNWICAAMSFGSGQHYRRDALSRAGVRPGAAILDVGTGTGLVAHEAARLLNGSGMVIGVDPSEGMLRAGRKWGRGSGRTSEASRSRIPFVQGCGERLPFADAAFDFVIMGNALRHVPDLEDTFREYFRVLRPGGRVLLLEVTRPSSRLGFRLARVYFGSIVPLVARLGTGSVDAAKLMRFYWDTIASAVSAPAVLAALEAAGFGAVTRQVLHGIFTEYNATKARPHEEDL